MQTAKSRPFRWVSFHMQSTRRRWKMFAMPAPASMYGVSREFK